MDIEGMTKPKCQPLQSLLNTRKDLNRVWLTDHDQSQYKKTNTPLTQSYTQVNQSNIHSKAQESWIVTTTFPPQEKIGLKLSITLPGENPLLIEHLYQSENHKFLLKDIKPDNTQIHKLNMQRFSIINAQTPIINVYTSQTSAQDILQKPQRHATTFILSELITNKLKEILKMYLPKKQNSKFLFLLLLKTLLFFHLRPISTKLFHQPLKSFSNFLEITFSKCYLDLTNYV
ncbi:hypothetical protein ABPG72_008237 [Tetrahymena utriculariae]